MFFFFSLVMRTFKIYSLSNFQIYNTVLLLFVLNFILFYTAGSYQLSILYILVYICQSQSPSSFHPHFPPLVSIRLFSYVCVSISALQTGSSVPFFQIPHGTLTFVSVLLMSWNTSWILQRRGNLSPCPQSWNTSWILQRRGNLSPCPSMQYFCFINRYLIYRIKQTFY